MRILLAQFYSNTPTPEYDQIAHGLRQRGHSVWLMTPAENDELVVSNGSEIISRIPVGENDRDRLSRSLLPNKLSAKRGDWITARRVREFIRSMDPDIVQVNPADLSSYWFLPLGFDDETRFVVDWRQVDEREYGGFLSGLKRWFHMQRRRMPSRYIFDQACFLHEAGAQHLLGEPWPKWGSVVPMGIEAAFLADYPTGPNEAGADGREVKFLYLGRISRIRNLELILQAAREAMNVVGDDRPFRIDLLGADHSDGYYQKQIETLGLHGVAYILPPVPYGDVPAVAAGYDIALTIVPEKPRDWQYHPTLKVLEYRALGLANIATDVAPNRELVQDGINGYLVQNSVESLAEAMISLIEDQALLDLLLRNAETMRQGTLWTQVAEQYELMYEELLLHVEGVIDFQV